MASFSTAYQIVQTNEGWSGRPGIDNNGGRVRYGVNEKAWPDMPTGFYSGAMDDATALAAAEGHYRGAEWAGVMGDQIHDQLLANHALDMAVNAGIGGAVMVLQAVLNDAFGLGLALDGKMGPATLQAANDHPETKALFRAARTGYYVAESLTSTGKGWLSTWLMRLKACG